MNNRQKERFDVALPIFDRVLAQFTMDEEHDPEFIMGAIRNKTVRDGLFCYFSDTNIANNESITVSPEMAREAFRNFLEVSYLESDSQNVYEDSVEVGSITVGIALLDGGEVGMGCLNRLDKALMVIKGLTNSEDYDTSLLHSFRKASEWGMDNDTIARLWKESVEGHTIEEALAGAE